MLSLRLVAALASLLLLQSAFAAEAPLHADAASPPDASPVVIDGVELFSVAGSTSFPSAQRSQQVSARIIAAAQDSRNEASAIRAQPRDGRIDILVGSRHLVAVVAEDAALEGVSLNDAALIRTMRIREALVRYRVERTSEYLTKAALTAFAATVIATLALLLTVIGFRRALREIQRRYHNRVRSLSIQSFEIVRAETLWRAVTTMLRLLRLLLVAAIIYAWFAIALAPFPWTRGFAGRLAELIGAPVVAMGAEVLQYIPKLAFLIVLIVVVRYLLKLMRVFTHAVGSGRVPLQGFDAEWAQPTYHIFRILVILLALVIAYPYLPGSGSAAFQGLSIFAGLMLSLGASSAMASIIAGYTVTYRRAFRVGDRITIGEFTGEVSQVRLMVTHLRTAKNEEVVVPNSLVLQSHVVNYSKLAQTYGLILHTTVSIGYEVPWRQVEALLLIAAERTSGMLETPRPFVLEKALGDFAVTYELNAYVAGASEMPQRYAALHRNILDVFNEHGVQIMTPAYEGDPEQPKVVPKSQWYISPARATEA